MKNNEFEGTNGIEPIVSFFDLSYYPMQEMRRKITTYKVCEIKTEKME